MNIKQHTTERSMGVEGIEDFTKKTKIKTYQNMGYSKGSIKKEV